MGIHLRTTVYRRTDFSKNALHNTLLQSANDDSLRLEQISLYRVGQIKWRHHGARLQQRVRYNHGRPQAWARGGTCPPLENSKKCIQKYVNVTVI